MRLISYQSGEGVRTAGKRGDGYFDLNTLDAQIPTCMNALLAGGSAMLSRVGAALESAAGEPLAADGSIAVTAEPLLLRASVAPRSRTYPPSPSTSASMLARISSS